MTLARLTTAHQLAGWLGNDDLVVLDCRFALDDPQWGRQASQQDHIPGALHADLERQLSAAIQPGISGRHPLPDAETVAAFFRSCGISADSKVVLYDDGPGAFACRAWWLLLWLGKSDDVWLLDGGYKAWQAAGLPVSNAVVEPVRGDLPASPDMSLLIDADSLQTLLERCPLLLDARALPRFRGEVEPIDPVAGHIPGARCLPFTDNLGSDGHFLPVAQLQQRFAALPVAVDQHAVAYCGSGVTACHNLFALALAGYPLPRLYAGSWSEWITDPARPIASGD